MRIEDLVLVTETGCEVLNAAPKDLRVEGKDKNRRRIPAGTLSLFWALV